MEHAIGGATNYDATLHVLFVIDSEPVETGMVPRTEGVERGRVSGRIKRDEATAGEGSMSRNEELADKFERRGHRHRSHHDGYPRPMGDYTTPHR